METEVVWLSSPKALDSISQRYQFKRRFVEVNLKLEMLLRGENIQIQAEADLVALAWKRLKWTAESFRELNRLKFKWDDPRHRSSEADLVRRYQMGVLERHVLAPTEILFAIEEAYNPNFRWYVAPFDLGRRFGTLIFFQESEGRLRAKSFTARSKEELMDSVTSNGVFGLYEKPTDVQFDVIIESDLVKTLEFSVPVIGNIKLERQR